jgi:hypothetical protein
MMPDEYQKLKQDILAGILKWCDEAGVDPHNSAQVQACAREIYGSLEESNVLHPEMTYAGFVSGMREGIFMAQWREAQAQMREQMEAMKPRKVVNVPCEVTDL